MHRHLSPTLHNMALHGARQSTAGWRACNLFPAPVHKIMMVPSRMTVPRAAQPEAEGRMGGIVPRPQIVASELEQAALQDALADQLYHGALEDGEAGAEAERLAEAADEVDPALDWAGLGHSGDPLLEPDAAAILSETESEGEEEELKGLLEELEEEEEEEDAGLTERRLQRRQRHAAGQERGRARGGARRDAVQ